MKAKLFHLQAAFVAVCFAIFPLSSMAQTEGGDTSSVFQATNPSVLLVGQPFSIDILAGPCEALEPGPSGAIVQSIVGSTVEVTVPGFAPLGCGNTPMPHRYTVAGFAQPGTYKVEVYILETAGPPRIVGYIGARTVTVVAGPGVDSTELVNIPVSDTWSLLTLTLTLVLAGAYLLSKSRKRHTELMSRRPNCT